MYIDAAAAAAAGQSVGQSRGGGSRQQGNRAGYMYILL